MQEVIRFIEIGLFLLCLYFAYLGCKQDMRQANLINLPMQRERNKHRKQIERSIPEAEAPASALNSPELPTYSEIVS